MMAVRQVKRVRLAGCSQIRASCAVILSLAQRIQFVEDTYCLRLTALWRLPSF